MISLHSFQVALTHAWNKTDSPKVEPEYIEDIQIFGMNMPFISSSEARKCIFHSWRENEIYIFSLHSMK